MTNVKSRKRWHKQIKKQILRLRKKTWRRNLRDTCVCLKLLSLLFYWFWPTTKLGPSFYLCPGEKSAFFAVGPHGWLSGWSDSWPGYVGRRVGWPGMEWWCQQTRKEGAGNRSKEAFMKPKDGKGASLQQNLLCSIFFIRKTKVCPKAEFRWQKSGPEHNGRMAETCNEATEQSKMDEFLWTNGQGLIFQALSSALFLRTLR